ncbi:hypothetical protein F4859DRAFT_492294 [Xylaria cf. heliscus]|nr:hypothetical protein F4859DRAFT_492294 [Xylaria cf. heliscus]
MNTSTPTFSPERCADLHNQLLAKAIEHGPTLYTERTLANRFLEAAPEFADIPSLESLPLYRFLRLLDTTPPVGNQFAALLTPLMFQPDPTIFWSERVGQEPQFLLDIQTYRAVWDGGDTIGFPPTDEWLPLEAVLQKSLDAWTTGKFYWNAETATIDTRCWTQHDLEQSIAAWSRLLSSIELRIPREADATHPPRRLGPLSPQLLAPFHISAFGVKFLSMAERPAFSFVAPGVRSFSASLLTDVYGAEAPDSRRKHFLGDAGEKDWPTLILPGVGRVPHDISHNTDLQISSCDLDWGFGKFTVNRQSGLYLMPDVGNCDVVRFVTASGLCTVCEFRSRYRWGPARDPKLAEVFNHWATLVENGTWKVDSSGVCDSHTWFISNIAQAQLVYVQPSN